MPGLGPTVIDSARGLLFSGASLFIIDYNYWPPLLYYKIPGPGGGAAGGAAEDFLVVPRLILILAV